MRKLFALHKLCYNFSFKYIFILLFQIYYILQNSYSYIKHKIINSIIFILNMINIELRNVFMLHEI